jgi:hypothetical protein
MIDPRDKQTIVHPDPRKEHRLHAVFGCAYCDIGWLNSDPDPTGQNSPGSGLCDMSLSNGWTCTRLLNHEGVHQ